MNYALKTIKDLCTKITDGSHFSPAHAENGEYYMYSVKDMLYNGFDNSDCKLIDLEMFQKLSKSDCRPLTNDILIAKDGSYLKYVFKVKKDLNACILSSIAILRPNIEIIDPDYFVYVLRTNSMKSAMANYVSGSALPRIILSDFKKMKVKMVADIGIQKKIADVLSAYDDLIENNNKRIELLEDMAQELYKEWFVRKAKSDWQLLRLKDFGYTLESGTRPKGGIDDSLEDGVPSLGAESIDSLGEFDYSKVKLIPHEFFDKMKRGIGRDKAILLYKDGAYIGKVALFMDNFPFEQYAINEHVFFVSANEEAYQYYLYFTLNQPQYFTEMQNLNRNAAQPGLTQKDIDIVKVKRPDIETVRKFNSIVEPILHKIFILAKSKRLLSMQRDLLLPRLMSGKLEV